MSDFTRRSLLAASSSFLYLKPQLVRSAGAEKLRAGVIGLGGRGRQAVVDLLTADERTECVAAADIFEDHLEHNLQWLTTEPRHAAIAPRVRVSPDHRFLGFDAYRKLLATDIDLVILATPPGYRPEHFEAAVQARKHVFCEKPFGTDPTGVRRFMAAARKSEELKLTVVSGAQRRFATDYIETIDKIRNGVIGDVLATYAYWIGTPVIQQKARNPRWGEMEWRHRNWYSHLWLCGDQIVEQHLHNIDVINWLMDSHPLSVVAHGGAAWRPRDDLHGPIFDHIAADFIYPNGVRLSSYCRQYPGEKMYRNVSELVIATKGRSNARDLGAKGENPYVAEHRALVASIRGDGRYINHAMAVAESTMTCIMARESAYSGLEISWDMIMESRQDLAPKSFGYREPMPTTPLPVPGQYQFR
jgi:predicted dehydrogenase